MLRQRYLVLLTSAICSTSPSPRKTATVVGSVVPQAVATATAGCQATAGSRAATAGSRAATTGSRAAAAGSRAIATRSPPPRRRRPSLFEFLAPPPSPYYECQGDETPYLG
jgi:hypothetical protein